MRFAFAMEVICNGGKHFWRTSPAKEASADRSGPRNPAPGNYVRFKKLRAAS